MDYILVLVHNACVRALIKVKVLDILLAVHIVLGLLDFIDYLINLDHVSADNDGNYNDVIAFQYLFVFALLAWLRISFSQTHETERKKENDKNAEVNLIGPFLTQSAFRDQSDKESDYRKKYRSTTMQVRRISSSQRTRGYRKRWLLIRAEVIITIERIN